MCRLIVLTVVVLGVLAGPGTAAAPPVQAAAYVVVGSVDGRTLAARSPDSPRAMASLTKLMTVLVARERT